MAQLHSFRFSILGLVLIALFNGCCANNVCNCNDAQEDAIQLRFSMDASSTGFAATELDTIIIQRFPKKFTTTTVPESVTLLRAGKQVRDSVVLANAAPFAQSGSARLSQYRYVVQYFKDVPNRKSVLTTALVIDSVLLKGSYDGSGCCTCYHNTAKSVYLNSKPAQDIKESSVLTIRK